MKNNTLTMVVLVVVTGAIGFFGGMQFQKTQRPSQFRQFGQTPGLPNGAFGQRNGTGTRYGARPVAGDIINSDDKTVTVKLQDGSTKIVLVTGTTSINKAASGTKGDLTTGARIAAFGTENTDGTLTATNIQINPILRSAEGNGKPNPTAQPSP